MSVDWCFHSPFYSPVFLGKLWIVVNLSFEPPPRKLGRETVVCRKLRQECLFRDHHHCVVSRKFDKAEVRKRLNTNKDSTDDDRKPLKDLNKR
ncbi:hypothetical protein PAAG_05318 [Paracoccidioides lutzii Pb01]|uniref:Uncharacterized protein n=1 Tax=Paracoccidioides lutzii (strain ATCC MYA-826 / Pb01) TaxID=502779 RepID=C1H3H5_PARBA|nr:hypothetical protein PAAG_05318 [Paracoccidioides lutzii Pb01]EEH34269.2 hypothetical protein PAAG_05318 [Paracoccidioides lutzii Pb01]